MGGGLCQIKQSLQSETTTTFLKFDLLYLSLSIIQKFQKICIEIKINGLSPHIYHFKSNNFPNSFLLLLLVSVIFDSFVYKFQISDKTKREKITSCLCSRCRAPPLCCVARRRNCAVSPCVCVYTTYTINICRHSRT